MNKKVNNIKCKARRILKNGNIEKPSQKENILHYGNECSLDNLEKNEFYKNQVILIRFKILEFYINSRNLSSRDYTLSKL